MNIELVKFILRLVLFVVKTGQLNNAIRLAILAFQAKMSYDEAMDRLTGVYYTRQVEKATADYKATHPDDFKCRINVPGYEKFKEMTK